MPRGRKRSTSISQAEVARLALTGIDIQIQELQQKRDQLAKRIPGGGGNSPAARSTASVKASTAKPAKQRRPVSAATRRKLKAAAKKRWARIKGGQAA